MTANLNQLIPPLTTAQEYVHECVEQFHGRDERQLALDAMNKENGPQYTMKQMVKFEAELLVMALRGTHCVAKVYNQYSLEYCAVVDKLLLVQEKFSEIIGKFDCVKFTPEMQKELDDYKIQFDYIR